MRKHILNLALGSLTLILLVGCSDVQPQLVGLSYTDPTPSQSQWALKRNNFSTSNHLILDLVPPADGGAGFGIGMNLTVDTSKAVFAKVEKSDTELIQNGAYDLGSGAPFLKTATSEGDLMVGIFQKGISTSPASHNLGRVLSIAMEPLQPLAAGTVPFRVKQAKELRTEGMVNINVAIGTMEVK